MKEKVIIRKSEVSMSGYELVVIDEGVEKVLLINERVKKDPKVLILPENPSNRKYFSDSKVDKNGGEIELSYKESRSLDRSEKSEKSDNIKVSKSKVLEYMTEDERKIYDEIIEKCEKRMKRVIILEKIRNLEKELNEEV